MYSRKNHLSLLLLLTLVVWGCKDTKKETKEEQMKAESTQNLIVKSDFGTLPNGEKVEKYTLKNSAGMEIDVITYGGIITRWTAPNKNGKYEDIALGYNNLQDYLTDNPYFGALIGRYGNRIAKGKFSLDGKEYTLATNNNTNHLHGGNQGFDKVNWKVITNPTTDGASIALSYISKDSEEGYPGTLNTVVTYTLLDNNTLDISYKATTDQPTIVNLTQHTYFNLTGDFSSNILGHELSIDADYFLPVDDGLIPTGELKAVKGTPFDFIALKTIEKDIAQDDVQLQRGLGFDHCWVLNNQNSGIRKVATAYEPNSGRILEVFTDEPGIQFYSGNFLDGTLPAKGGGSYAHRSGFCLETQHYPDSPNQETFPSVRLNPGETYVSHTSYKLSVK